MRTASSSPTPMAISAAAATACFRDDTRVLSRFRLLLGGLVASLLGASLSPGQHPVHRQFDQPADGKRSATGARCRRASCIIERARLLWQEPHVSSGSRCPIIPAASSVVPIRLRVRSRFPRHVRSARHRPVQRRGQSYEPIAGEAHVAFHYDGLDGISRWSYIGFSRTPVNITPDAAEFTLPIAQRGREALFLEIGPEFQPPSRERFRAAAARARCAHAPEAAARRHRAQFRQGLQRLAHARPRRHRPADHRPRHRALPLCRAFPGSRRRSAATA